MKQQDEAENNQKELILQGAKMVTKCQIQLQGANSCNPECIPGEEGEPAEEEDGHDDAESLGRLVLALHLRQAAARVLSLGYERRQKGYIC